MIVKYIEQQKDVIEHIICLDRKKHSFSDDIPILIKLLAHLHLYCIYFNKKNSQTCQFANFSPKKLNDCRICFKYILFIRISVMNLLMIY